MTTLVNMWDAENTSILLRERVPLTTLISQKDHPGEYARAENELRKTRRYWLRRYWLDEPSPPLFYLTLAHLETTNAPH